MQGSVGVNSQTAKSPHRGLSASETRELIKDSPKGRKLKEFG